MTVAGPPSAETRLIPLAVPKRIVPPPAGLQAPPEKSLASVRSSDAPPTAATFFKRPAVTYAMEALLGDQNGWDALSVPAILRAITAPTGRTYRDVAPAVSGLATNAIARPFGEMPMSGALRPMIVWRYWIASGAAGPRQ